MHFNVIRKLLPLVFFSSVASAGDLHVGGYLKAGRYGVEDPDGSTETADNVAPALKILYELDARGQRVFGGLEYISFSLDPEADTIAQDVDGYALLAGYERKIPLSRALKIWIGGSLSASSVDFTHRSVIANDGYLDQRLDDRAETYFSGALTLDSYFTVTDSLELGVGLYVDLPFGDGVESAGLRVTVQQY